MIMPPYSETFFTTTFFFFLNLLRHMATENVNDIIKVRSTQSSFFFWIHWLNVIAECGATFIHLVWTQYARSTCQATSHGRLKERDFTDQDMASCLHSCSRLACSLRWFIDNLYRKWNWKCSRTHRRCHSRVTLFMRTHGDRRLTWRALDYFHCAQRRRRKANSPVWPTRC